MLLLYFVDFGHYAYGRVRLNASLVDHLRPVGVAARVAWDTYPVLLCLLGLALLASAYFWIVRGAARHTRSASWALKELMPQSELWEVLPPHQTGQNTLEQILRFQSRFDVSARAA